MRPHWIILGLFLAGIAYGTVVWWPERPLWKTKISKISEILSFSEDSKSLWLLDEKQEDVNQARRPHVIRRDARTGQLLGEIPLPLLNDVDGPVYEINKSGTALLVRCLIHDETEFGKHVIYVFDIPSGQKRFGPVEGVVRAAFSRTGRWITCYRGEDSLSPDEVEVIDSQSAISLFRIGATEEGAIEGSCFAPDDSALALVQKDRDAFSLHILDIPKGKERAHLRLSERAWDSRVTWEDDHLILFAGVRSENDHEEDVKGFRFDPGSLATSKEIECPDLEQRFTKENIGENRPFKTNWREFCRGSEWKGELQLYHATENRIEQYCNDFAEWLGIRKPIPSEIGLKLRIWDVSANRIRYVSPPFLNSSSRIAADGKSYAVLSDDGELSLWKAESHLRWPWALALSVGILLVFLLIGRWRARVTLR